MLLNERIYTPDELGFPNSDIPPCIMQINIKKRLDYFTAFMFAKHMVQNAWVVLCNNDIFFDSTLQTNARDVLKVHSYGRGRRRRSVRANCATLLRWELGKDHPFLWNHPDPSRRGVSQDTWIFYSNQIKHLTIPDSTKFNLGVPGCDNRIAHILHHDMGFHCVNCPYRIRTYHNHSSNIRNYTKQTPPVKGPYLYIHPII